MPDDKKLAQLRVDIDALDNQLIDLISDRARLAQDVAEVKNASAEPANFYRPEREAQILKKVIEQNKGPLSEEEMARLFREIMSACLALEQQLGHSLSRTRRDLYPIRCTKTLWTFCSYDCLRYY